MPRPLRARADALAARCALPSRLLPTLRVCCCGSRRRRGDVTLRRFAPSVTSAELLGAGRMLPGFASRMKFRFLSDRLEACGFAPTPFRAAPGVLVVIASGSRGACWRHFGSLFVAAPLPAPRPWMVSAFCSHGVFGRRPHRHRRRCAPPRSLSYPSGTHNASQLHFQISNSPHRS